MLREIIGGCMIALGVAVFVTAVAGVYRFKYVLNRMHAAALGDTLGILLIVLGLVVINGLNLTSCKALLLVVLWWLSSPVASHLISRLEVTTNQHLEENMAVKTESDPHKEVEA